MEIVEFAKKIRDEAHEINVVNMQVLDFDEEIEAMEKALAAAIETGDDAAMLDMANRVRAGMIETGYMDDDELPRLTDEA